MSNTAVETRERTTPWWQLVLSALGLGYIGQPLFVDKAPIVSKIYVPGSLSPVTFGANFPPRWVVTLRTRRGELPVGVGVEVYDNLNIGDAACVQYRACRWTGRLKGKLW